MTAWSCSGMQRNPPLVLGLFILTLLLLMGCGSGTSTGAPGPPYVSPDPSRSPRRLKRKVELRSAQLRMDPVSAGEGVSQTDLLSIGLEHAASVFPSSQLPSSIPARMRREERSVEVPQSPLPFRKRRRCPGASGEFRSRGGRHALSPQALEREPSPPPPAAVSAPPALPSWEPLLAAPPPSPQQVQSVAIPVSLPETPSTPQQPALMPSHPPVHPLALRMTARGPTPMQLLGRPVATLAAAAVPARPLVPQGQQSPQQPPVLLIFPHQESPLPPTPVATHPPVEPIPGTPQPPQNQPAHLTGQVPQSGGSMESIVNSTTAHSTLNADVVSTCVLALQNALHQIQCRTQTQTSTLQTQSPVQNTLSTQVAEPQNLGGKTGQIPQQQPTLSTTQKPPTDVVIQHNAEGSLMLTLSRGAVLPASGPPTSSVSPTTSILLQIELPMGTPPSGDAPNPSLLLRSPQIQSAPTTHATTRLQEVWLKEPLVESKPALRSTFQRLNHHREHMDRRLQRQTAPDAQPQEEEQGESTAPGGEGGERPLRRCSSNPERLDVRWKTERISDAVAPDAQDAPRRRRDSVKRRSNRKVDVESDFIPRAKRPRHRIEVPDTFFPLASQLAGLVTTRAAYMINRDHVWPLFKKVETNMDDGDSGRERLERVNPVNLGISELSGDSIRNMFRDKYAQSPATGSGDSESVGSSVPDSVSKAQESGNNFTTKNTVKTIASTAPQVMHLSEVRPKDFIKLLNMKPGGEKPSGSWQLAYIVNTCEPKKPKKKCTTKKSTCKKKTTTPAPITCLESHVREFHVKQHEKYHRAPKQRERIGELLRMITSAPSPASVKPDSCLSTTPKCCLVGSPQTIRTPIQSTRISTKLIEVTGITRYWSTPRIFPSGISMMNMSSTEKFEESNAEMTDGSTKVSQNESEITNNLSTSEIANTTETIPVDPTSSTVATVPTFSDTNIQFADDSIVEVTNGSTAQTTNGPTLTTPGTNSETNLNSTILITNGTIIKSSVGSTPQNLLDTNTRTAGGSLVLDALISTPAAILDPTAPTTYDSAAPDTNGTTSQAMYDNAQAPNDTTVQTISAATAQDTSGATTQVASSTADHFISSATTQIAYSIIAQNVTEYPSSESTNQITNGSTGETTQVLNASNTPEGPVVPSITMEAMAPAETTLLPSNTLAFEEPKSSEITSTSGSFITNSANVETSGISTKSEIPASTINTQTTFWTSAETILGTSVSESTRGTATPIGSPTIAGITPTETSATLVSSKDIGSTETAPTTYSAFQISYSTVSKGA